MSESVRPILPESTGAGSHAGGRLTRPRRASHEAKNRARARFFGRRKAWSSDGLELTDNLVADLIHRSDSMDLDVLGGAFAALLGP